MLHKRHLRTLDIVIRHRLVKYRKIARFLDIGYGSEDKPHGVVVESASYVVVATLSQRLILMIASSVGKLRGCYVDDSLSCAGGNLMDKAHKILIGIAESHTPAYAAFKEGGRAGETERDHTLILVPYVDHAVKTLVARLKLIAIEQSIPI